MLEGFFDLVGYPNDSTSKGTWDIKKYFAVTLPNMIYSNDKDVDLAKLTETANVRIQKSESVLKNDWKKGLGSIGDTMAAKQAACESVGNGDQFEHLSSLASTEDKNSRLRCGWTYNNSNPSAGRGGFGNSEGPFKPNAQGIWMWNLDAAKEKYHGSICSNIQGCADIDGSIYKQRCGWCTKSGKAVPIVNKGVAYPYNTNTACPANQLITQGSKCPPPPPLEDPTGPRAPGELCTPLENGALPRDCLIAKVTAAGCSDNGTIAQALRAGSSNDYTNVLRQQQAYTVYQERATVPLDATGLKTGKISISDAINGFSKVQDLASSNANTGLAFAARDLCLNKGAIDQFDFCTEINDNTTGPFSLDCLQKVFLRAGGQKAGSAYPSTSTASKWNALGNWAAVKANIQEIFARTRSKDRSVQEVGMMEFYGIRLQNKHNPLPYGPEIAWKDSRVKTSCQRPLATPSGYTSAGCIDDESNDMLDKWAERNGWTMGTPPPPAYMKVPNVDWAGNDIHHTTGQTLEQCQEECTKRPDCVGHNYGFGTGEKHCWIKSNLQNRWNSTGIYDFYIKQPLQCKAPYGNPVSGTEGEYKGCYRDDISRTISNSLGNTQDTNECWERVKARGFNVMGRQYFGECFGGNNTDWDRLGNAGCCEPLGGAWTNQVYVRKSPKDVPLSELQSMWEKAGCTRKLEEGHVGWWRDRPHMNDIINDMNAYGSITRGCSGSKGQHEFCIPGKCK